MKLTLYYRYWKRDSFLRLGVCIKRMPPINHMDPPLTSSISHLSITIDMFYTILENTL